MAKPLTNRETRETLIGVSAVLVLIVILGWSYGSKPRAAAVDEDGFQLLATFNRVDGLVAGDPVFVSGVKVGTVADLDLTDTFRVVATLRLDSPVALPDDTSAAIHTDGLFGSKFVVLDPGGAERMLEDGDRIDYTQDAVIISKLFELIINEGRAARQRAETKE